MDTITNAINDIVKEFNAYIANLPPITNPKEKELFYDKRIEEQKDNGKSKNELAHS
jgi:hypothetical protein